MIRIVYKKDNKRVQEKVLESKQQVINEVAIVAKALQDNVDENIRIKESNSRIGLENSLLKGKKIGLSFEKESLELDIKKKKEELGAIEGLIGERNSSLIILNNILVKVSEKYSEEIGQKLSELNKIKIDEAKYKELEKRYGLLQQKVNQLDGQKLVKEKDVEKAENERITAKKLTKEQQNKLEQFKSEQAELLRSLKFYAGRLNRYYQSLQLPPPVDVSHL